MRATLFLAGSLMLLAACDTPTSTGAPDPGSPDPAATDDELITAEAWHAGHPGIAPIRLYSQNVYVGTDVDAVIAAGATSSDPTVLFGAILGALQVFDATRWDERADRIARAVARQDPDVIGLNEIANVARRGLGDYGVADNATEFLPVLLEALARKGLRYDVVGSIRNTDVLIPLSIDPSTGQVIFLPDGLPAAFVSLTDFDVLLARRGAPVANVVTKNYQAYLPVNLGPLPLQIRRGYVAADVTVRGTRYRIATTHPEPRSPVKEIQEAQVAELLGDLAATTLPTVAMGDFNSEPTDPAGSPYAQMRGAGFTDLWTRRIGLPASGATCCQVANLTGPSQLNRRLDQVWMRPGGHRRVGPVVMTVFGDAAWERTASGLWPSDHGGLFAGVLLLP